MKTKKSILIILLFLISNVLTYIFASKYSMESYAKETTNIYQGMLGRYLIELENNNTQLVQTYMSGFIFPSIVDLGKKKSIDKNYKYLCEAWSAGLDGVIRKEIFKNSTKKEGMYNTYLEGAKKLDKFCTTEHPPTATTAN